MYVRELMTPRVVAVDPNDTLTVARAKLRENRIHHLLVMDKSNVVGLLSYRDLIGRGEHERVAEVMSRDVQTVEPWASVRSAAALMLGRTHGCLAVVEDGRVTGIITTTDLLRGVTAAKQTTASANIT